MADNTGRYKIVSGSGCPESILFFVIKDGDATGTPQLGNDKKLFSFKKKLTEDIMTTKYEQIPERALIHIFRRLATIRMFVEQGANFDQKQHSACWFKGHPNYNDATENWKKINFYIRNFNANKDAKNLGWDLKVILNDIGAEDE